MGKSASEDNPISIRSARTGEAAAVTALIHRAFAQYRGTLQPPSSAASETPATVAQAMTTGTVLIAVDNGTVVGCVSLQRRVDCAYAGRLAVDPPARGKGIGRALMAAAEALARETGAPRMRADVRLALTENRAFFRSLGFAEGAHRCHPGFASPTYVELEKSLI